MLAQGLTAATAGVLVAGLTIGPSMATSSAEDPSAQASGDRASFTSSGTRAAAATRRRTASRASWSVRRSTPAAAPRASSNDFSYEIAPGVTLREWDQIDGRQPVGQVRMNLLSINLDAPNITFEELSPKYVTSRKKVSQLGRWNNVLGAVNGDFFDISQTGAPLGIAINRDRGVLNAAREGWIPENSSLWFDGTGPHINPLTVQYTIRQFKDWTVTGINHPTVPAGEIGVFTHDWGKTSGYEIPKRGKGRAREVILRKNRVISNKPKLSKGARSARRTASWSASAAPPASSSSSSCARRSPCPRASWAATRRSRSPATGRCWSTASRRSSTTPSPTLVRRWASTPTDAGCSSWWSTDAPRRAAATPWSSSPTS